MEIGQSLLQQEYLGSYSRVTAWLLQRNLGVDDESTHILAR